MADEVRMALAALLRKAAVEPGVAVLREGGRALAEARMEPAVERHLGAGRSERTPARTEQRNGYRARESDTRVGTVERRGPRGRAGGYVPSRLEPRKRAEWALLAVGQEAYVAGVGTRRVDDLAKALGLAGISQSQVGRLCQALAAEVERFRSRPLTVPYPALWLDATFVTGREAGRAVNQAVVSAVGVTTDGGREALGAAVGPSEDGAFWLGVLRGLVARGLGGVRLAVGDARAGLGPAIGAGRHGAGWQRCRVHFRRNALALVPTDARQLVAATIRPVFAQPTVEAARQQWRRVAAGFRPRFPRLAAVRDAAEADGLAYLAFPPRHWRQIRSATPLARLNPEGKRRPDGVGSFPPPGAVGRLVGAPLAEQHDEWRGGRRYLSAESRALRGEAAGVPPARAADYPPGGAAAPPGGEDHADLHT